LVALAEILNFTKPASQRFVTQSTLSGGIQGLKRLLGATLVERNLPQVRSTELALKVVERARMAVPELRIALREDRTTLQNPGSTRRTPV